jgi:leader peptidase (prepilin peptidase)/N-methyltransferase
LWVELIVGVLWAFAGWEIFAAAPELSFGIFDYNAAAAITDGVGRMIFLWLLVALAVLDIENLWLPDRLTLPGIGLGLVLATTRGSLDAFLRYGGSFAVWKHLVATDVVLFWLLGAVLSAGVLLLIRWVYGLIRREEGVGLGDVKLMALLGGWLGARCAVLALGFGAILGTVVALLLLATPAMRADREAWRQKKLPMGAFIAVGGVFSAFWGEQLIAAYRQWSGLW